MTAPTNIVDKLEELSNRAEPQRNTANIKELRMSAAPIAIDIEGNLEPRLRPFSTISEYKATFFLFVVLPAVASIVYLTFVAANQYVAETKFALRAAQIDFGREKTSSQAQTVGSPIPSLSLPAIAGQDAFVVAAYVRSAAIFADLPKTLDLRVIFRRPEADFWARLPDNASVETITDYWRSMVSTYVDSNSGIVTVSIRAFRPDDALLLAREVALASERLINNMSARVRSDAMMRAEAEVRRAEKLVQDALNDMRAYRDKEGIISPTAEANSTSTLLLTALGERIRLQTEFNSATRMMSASAPTLVAIKSRLDAADRQIESLKQQLTGTGNSRTVSASIARYEGLELQRIFSEKLYLMSQEALERARQKAERQSVYITTFVPPRLPEEAQFPRRFAYSFLIPIGFIIVWGIFALLAATIRDHQI